MKYVLHREPAYSKDGPVRCERVGDALKRLSHPNPSIIPSRSFHGQRNSGRKRTEGWSRTTRATVREKLELHREVFQSCIHIQLPTGIPGMAAKSIFKRLQRWHSARGIPALGIAETPNPHFHIAIGIPHSEALEQDLRRVFAIWWLNMFHREPPATALHWKPSSAPRIALVKYLSKSTKGGRHVKGKAPWLTFSPYFTTCLPRHKKEHLSLTTQEAEKVLGPNSLTYGAYASLEKLRTASGPPEPETPLQT